MLNISAKLNLITSNFSSGIRAATDMTSGFANKANKAFSGVSSGAARVSSSISSASSAAGASMKKTTSKAEKSLESMSGSVNAFGQNINKALNNGFVDPAKHAGVKWKDVARIIQGIMISRVFYDSLQSINAARDAVWNFAQELEKTKIAFDNLFGDTALTERFMAVLKDTAIDNALFDFGAMEDAAKRLLAYGIDYSNLMYVMQGVMSAASVTGDPAKVESISRALGQIYTKGRLMGQEVLQLTEAGVPVFDILNEKMGITEKEMANIADQGITATEAINALVDGLTEKYGSVLTASKYTMVGMINNVKDVLLMLGEQAIQPVFNFTKAVLYQVQQGLETAYKAMKTGGLGAAFESLIPDSLQTTLRMVISAFSNLGLTLGKIGLLIKNVSEAALPGLAYAFSTVVYVILPVINSFVDLLRMLTQNIVVMRVLTAATAAAATAFLLLKARALGLLVIKAVVSVITAVSKALGIMAAMASTASRSLLLIVGLALAIGAGFASATGTLDGLIKRLSSLSGYSTDILMPGEGTGTGDIDEFNNKLEGTADAYEDIEEAAGGAKKATDKYKAGLLSFDEVFKLNEPNDPASGGGGSGSDIPSEYADLALGGIDASSLIPEVPDFGDFAVDFVKGLSNSLLGKLGMAGIAGMLAAKLGKQLKDVSFKDIGKGAAGFATKFLTVLGKTLTGALGGFGISSILSIFTDRLWDSLEESFGLQKSADRQAKLGATIGATIGGAIGMILGGPVGLVIGSVIGHFAGGLFGLFWEKVTDAFKIVGKGMSTLFGKVLGAVATFVADSYISFTTWLGNLDEAISGWIVKTLADFAGWFSGVVEGLSGFITSTYTAISGWIVNIISGLSSFFTTSSKAFDGWFSGVMEGLSGFITSAYNALSGWIVNTISSLSSFFTTSSKAFDNWFTGVMGAFATWFSNTLTKLATWLSDMKTKLSTWFSGMTTRISTWWSDLWDPSRWKAGWTAVKNWFTNLASGISSWFSGLIASITSMWNKLWNPKNWMSGWTAIKKWFSDLFSSISSWFTSLKSSISTWWDNLWAGKSANVSASANSISGAVSGAVKVTTGHAIGGIFDREHIARFAEGNKAEMVVPLENASAMRPFVNAVSQGVLEGIAPALVSTGSAGTNANQLPPMFVGTLIADERGLKQLYKKFEVIQAQENARKGLAAT